MRNFILCLLTILSATLVAQDQSLQKARELLKQSVEKCKTIKEGTYRLEKHMKFMDNKDTSHYNYETSFMALPEDTILKFQVSTKRIYNDSSVSYNFYTGSELVFSSYTDSIAERISLAEWPKEVEAYADNLKLYKPFTHPKHHPLPGPKTLSDSSEYHLSYLGEINLNGRKCHKIRIWKSDEVDTSEFMSIVWTEFIYYINPEDSVPVAFKETLDAATKTDTSRQYRFLNLVNYSLEPLDKDLSVFTPYLPDYFKVQAYKPKKEPEPLPIDTVAPSWKLVNLNGDSVSLSDYKGQVVLLDFFYKSCYPCQLAMPALQRLHEKYDGKGLKVAGIDPVDDKEEDDLANFLDTRGVDYEILLAPREFSKAYRVQVYPTVYILDREGKIRHVQLGYGEATEEKLEEEILKYL